MADRDDDQERRRAEHAEAVTALVGAQLRDARAEVFRAYVRARDQARELVERDAQPRGRRVPPGPS